MVDYKGIVDGLNEVEEVLTGLVYKSWGDEELTSLISVMRLEFVNGKGKACEYMWGLPCSKWGVEDNED